LDGVAFVGHEAESDEIDGAEPELAGRRMRLSRVQALDCKISNTIGVLCL
jgi:hypothetical protein